MTEYIDREAVIKRLEETQILRRGIPREVRAAVIDLVMQQPAADVAPVRHGRWIGYDGDSWKCSICGEEDCYAYDLNVNRFTDKYCPNCGAKMDGGDDDAAD